MSSYRDERKWSNTNATKQGRIVMTADFDRKLLELQKRQKTGNYADFESLYKEAPMDDMLMGVEQGEPLIARNNDVLLDAVTKAQRQLGNKRRKLRNTGPAPKAISKVNGVAITAMMRKKQNLLRGADEDQNTATALEMARKMYRFVGFSNTHYVYDSKYKELQKTGLAVQFGGTLSTINTGDQNIKAFQKVVWDFPSLEMAKTRPNFAGRDKRSIGVALKPFDPTNLATFEACMEYCKTLDAAAGTKKPEPTIGPNVHDLCSQICALAPDGQCAEYLENAKGVFFCMGLNHHEQRERIVGIALTSSSPFEQFDIMAGRHH